MASLATASLVSFELARTGSYSEKHCLELIGFLERCKWLERLCLSLPDSDYWKRTADVAYNNNTSLEYLVLNYRIYHDNGEGGVAFERRTRPTCRMMNLSEQTTKFAL